MGMFDYLRCQYPLPVEGANALEFQTKDTDAQYLDLYELREDGTLWHEAYDLRTEDDESAPLGIYQYRDNPRWEQEPITGEIRFYTSRGNGAWIEFSAYFAEGKMRELHVIADKAPNAGLAFMSLPYPAELDRRKERRFRVPMLVAQTEGRHLSRRFSIPIGAYLGEIRVCQLAAKARDCFLGPRVIRAAVERTLGLKFRDGQRGFCQWLLKHPAWARLPPEGSGNFRIDNRRKVEEPAINFNPTMKILFSNGDGFSFGVGKRNRLRAAKIEGRRTNNGSGLQPVMPDED